MVFNLYSELIFVVIVRLFSFILVIVVNSFLLLSSYLVRASSDFEFIILTFELILFKFEYWIMLLERKYIVFEVWFNVKVNFEYFFCIFIILIGFVEVKDGLFKFFINGLRNCFLL